MYRPAHYGQVDLGVAYANGKGVARDHIRAYKWLSLAASQGDEHALVIRNWVATRMTPGQIAGAQRLAREWTPMSDQKATTSPPERSIIRQKAVALPRRFVGPPIKKTRFLALI
jgi:TPR repeat protein